MARMPILPTNIEDPTGVDRKEHAAIAEWSIRLRKVRQLYAEALAQLPHRTVTANVTQYETTPTLLQSLLDQVAVQVTRILLNSDAGDLWFLEAAVVPAYQQGTAQQLANLSVQSSAYAASRQNLTALLQSQPYQTRLGFLRARLTTRLEGYASSVQTGMSQVLQDGLALGKNPRQVAEDLKTRVGIDYRKAEEISRTEIPGALRDARMAEADQVRTELGIKSLEMHMSACSPTTRLAHYQRMGTLHTTEEQRLWWASGGNRYNCKCSTVTVLVGEDGKPLAPGVIARALRIKEENPLPGRDSGSN